MKTLIGAVFLFLALHCGAQMHSVSVNANFFLTQIPVFKAGYEFSPDSSHLTYALNGEFGRFSYTSKDFLTSSIDAETSVGFGVMPELRYYLNESPEPFGTFISSFIRLRRAKKEIQEGVYVTENGIQINDPSIHYSIDHTLRYGFALGYRSGCRANLLHIEILGGAFAGDLLDRSNQISSISRNELNEYLRIELNLVAVF